MSDEERLALERLAAAGDPFARARLERLLDRQPTAEIVRRVEGVETQLLSLFGTWFAIEPGGRALVARAILHRDVKPENFTVVVGDAAVTVERPAAPGLNHEALLLDRLAAERWARLNS